MRILNFRIYIVSMSCFSSFPQLYSDLGDIKYVSLGSANGNSIIDAMKNNYDAGNIPYNSTILGIISYSGTWGISGYTYPKAQNYCSFILHKYGDDEIIHIRNMNGSWSSTPAITDDDLTKAIYARVSSRITLEWSNNPVGLLVTIDGSNKRLIPSSAMTTIS